MKIEMVLPTLGLLFQGECSFISLLCLPYKLA